MGRWNSVRSARIGEESNMKIKTNIRAGRATLGTVPVKRCGGIVSVA